MALKPASRPRHDSHDVQLATWDLIRAVHRRLEPDSPEAKYLADRLRRESPGGERLPADPIVGSWNLGSRGKLNAANCRVWTRRIRMLEMINRSVERLLAEETQDAAIELAGACPLPASDVKRSLPAWWNGACDFSLLYGVYRHGFGNFNAVRSDPWTAAVATEAAREKGGAGAVAELRDSIEAIDECQKLYAQAREEHGARMSEHGRVVRKGGPDGSKGEEAKEEEKDSAEEDGDDGDDEGVGDDDDAGNNVPAVGGDKSELIAAAKERVERIHEGENAWPRTEDLTDRVRRVAKELGAPNALKPSDPPWVQAMLGRPRRVPKPRMSLAERAARDQKRGESRARAAETESAREEFADAMMRGDWDALGKNGAAGSVTSLLCADHDKFDADEGINPEADELVRSTAAALKEKGISNRERKHAVKALMARGLPRLDDNSPDWIELSTMSGVGRGAEDVQAIFYSIAVEMKVLEARTDATGVKASKKHSATCKCIVCRIRKEKKNAEDPSKVTWKDAVKTMKEAGNASEAQTAASDPTANGRHRDEEDDEEEHEEEHDGDDGNDGEDHDDAEDGSPEREKNSEGVDEDHAAKPGKSRRASVCPFGLLTHVTANRLRERLDIMQTLRMCLEKSDGKMTRLPMPSIKTGELPVWWTSGVHDVAILRAALKHGCDKWEDLAGDAEFSGVFGKSRPVPKAPLCFRILRIASRYLRRGYLGLGKHTKRKKG